MYLNTESVSLKRLIISALIFTLPIVCGFGERVLATDTVVVGYGGIYTPGNENNFPFYKKNKIRLNKVINSTLEKISSENEFPFELLMETDAEGRKKDIDNPYTMAVILTRDDVSSESFKTSVAKIHKTVVNVGMIFIIYQTIRDNSGKRNAIIFSVPLVGYSVNLEGKEPITESALNELFLNTAKTTLQEHLIKRLKGISLEKIEGIVTDIKNGKALINIGSVNGLTDGQNITILTTNKKKVPAVLDLLKKNEAVISARTAGFIPEKNMKVYGYNMKGMSDETYQIVSFTISSKKAAKLFDQNIIGPQVSQWLSDFISERSGKVVFPAKVGGEWVTSSTEQSFMKLTKDGEEHIFVIPPAKYPIKLCLTGVSAKIMDKNNVNEIWAYKSWLKVEIPAKNYSQEFSEGTSKSVVSGIQSFDEKDELFDVIHQLTARVAKEGSL